MLQTIRERLSLALLALLPLHALAVTVLTKFVAGPGHRPLPLLALWKEGVIGILILLTILEIIIALEVQRRLGALRFLMFWKKPFRLKFDLLDVLILFGIVYGVLLSALLDVPAKQFALGFKYDFLPLVLFFVLRRVPWSEWFRTTAAKVVIGMGILLSLYGFVTLVLPMSFFVSLGYSDLHSLYNADGPLAAFQQIGGSALRRMQGAMSGPNQMGIWLLLPLGLVLGKGRWNSLPLQTLTTLLLLVAITLTLSRASWIGAFVILGWFLCTRIDRRTFLPVITLVTCFVLCIGITAVAVFPDVIFRSASSSDHLKKPLEALRIMTTYVKGKGLGAAGPASNAVSDTCVQLDVGADASWAKDRPDLCVFVAGQQVQPVGHTCSCPVLTENWYLQWGVEMGWIGLLLSVSIFVVVFFQCLRQPILLGFLGVSTAGLFLHSFEDAAVAYTVWLLLAAYKARTQA